MNAEIDSSSTSRIGPVLALSYLYFPFLLFDLGWIRPSWSIPIAVASFVGFILACRKMPELWVPSCSWRTFTKALSCAILLGLWVWSSGIGGYVWGEVDHLARNTVFKMLVERSWPLYSTGTPDLPSNAEPSILTYYLGFFLLPALVGKVTSLHMGFFALWCWAFFGVCLAYYLVCAKLRRLLVWPIFVFIFFSGADSVGVIIRGLHHPGVIPFWSATSNFEQWSAYNYSCQTTQLYWVYNQAVPAWIATSLLLCGIPASCMLFMATTLMINATFPFLAFCILAAAFAWKALLPGPKGDTFFRKSGRWLLSFLSVPNIIGPVSIGLPCFLYLSGNTAASHFGVSFHWTYPLFILLEVIVPMFPLYHWLWKDIRFRVVGIALLLIPFGQVGFGNDFISRTSIPFLFIILVWTVEFLLRALRERDTRRTAFFLVVLLVGSATALHEMSRTFVHTHSIPDLAAYWDSHNATESSIMQFRNPYVFTSPTAGNRFCGTLAIPPPADERKP